MQEGLTRRVVPQTPHAESILGYCPPGMVVDGKGENGTVVGNSFPHEIVRGGRDRWSETFLQAIPFGTCLFTAAPHKAATKLSLSPRVQYQCLRLDWRPGRWPDLHVSASTEDMSHCWRSSCPRRSMMRAVRSTIQRCLSIMSGDSNSEYCSPPSAAFRHLHLPSPILSGPRDCPTSHS